MLIYEPKGKAREYSPLSMNIFNGCDHGCTYCYVPACTFRPEANTKPLQRKNVLHDLEKELKKCVPKEQILLCFLCDPYPLHDVESAITRQAIEIFMKYECKIAILSKGGKRCIRDLDLFKKYPSGKIKFGTTLTFFNDTLRKQYEPKAATFHDRLDTLATIHDNGIKTFVSIEPVVDPLESLKVIAASLPHTDQYKIGKLNHDKTAKNTDWTKFLKDALSITRPYGKEIYVKADLREAAPSIQLTEKEKNMNALSL
jgi:DNA repair photolyase